MNLMPLANHLQAKGVGKQGTDLFINMLPAECNNGVLLRSPLTGVAVNYYLPGFHKGRFQIIARAHQYSDAYNTMDKALKELTIKTDTQLDDMLIRYSRPEHLPVAFPLSNGNFIEFNVWMSICFNLGA